MDTILDPGRGGRHAPNDSIFLAGVPSSCVRHTPGADCSCSGGPTSLAGVMNDGRVPEHNEPRSHSRHAGRLVGRDPEMDRIRAFLATARTDGGALLVTGEPGVGKTVL